MSTKSEQPGNLPTAEPGKVCKFLRDPCSYPSRLGTFKGQAANHLSSLHLWVSN